MHHTRLDCTRLLLFALLALGYNTAHAQQKYEREIRIRPEAVPATAKAFVAACTGKEKVHWYKEINLGFYSFEAKATRNGRRYSIEFDSLGVIQDVEIVIRFEHLTNVVQRTITAELAGRCSKYRITRVQRQWTGSANALQEVIREGSTTGQYTERFEIVFSCKTDKGPVLYEALFDALGNLENLLEIIPRNTDNLDY
ncbi:MAG: hypothetical protein IPM98_14320 [Lewinellaceae bacterium]|nr:hypothetical protein [Lewinellaceae bacterium]